MAVVRWDPWSELASLQRDVGELFQRTLPQGARQASALVPPIDAFRTDEGLVVRVELPGMSPDAVEVAVEDGALTISGERRPDSEVAEEQWIRRERAVGAFQRSFSLPEGTNAEEISAAFDHGLLELRIPHPPERKPHRVQIAASDGAQRQGGETVNVEAHTASGS